MTCLAASSIDLFSSFTISIPCFKMSIQSSIAPPWNLEMERIPAATAALSGAPVEATVNALSTDGGVVPWSTDETRIVSIIFPVFSEGISPLKSK